MVLLTIFNHNATLMMVYMVVLMSITLIGVSPQFSRNRNRGIKLTVLIFLAFAVALLPIQSGDFVYSAKILQTGKGIAHLEDFYRDLWQLCPNILVWRTIVFGSALLLLYWTIILLKINQQFACLIFAITEMFMFGAMRNTLGLMLMIWGVALYFSAKTPITKMLYPAVTVLALFLCTFLHRSMWLYVGLLIIGLIPYGKRSIRISIIAFPFLYVSIFALSHWFLGIFADAEMQQHAGYYTEGTMPTTLMKTINDLLKQGCYLYLLYVVIRNTSNGIITLTPAFKFLLRYSYALIYLGFLFYNQGTGGWLYSRFVGAGELTFMFVMMYFFYLYPRKSGVKLAFSGLIYYILYQMLYVTTYASSSYIERFNSISI